MKIIGTIIASIALALSGFVAAPALAADQTQVDVHVFTAASKSMCGGDGLELIETNDVAWTVAGEPVDVDGVKLLQYPNGFTGTVTATSLDGSTLIDEREREGVTLSWQMFVAPFSTPCDPPQPCVTQSDELDAQLAVTQAKVERQRATIKRLRAKLHRR